MFLTMSLNVCKSDFVYFWTPPPPLPPREKKGFLAYFVVHFSHTQRKFCSSSTCFVLGRKLLFISLQFKDTIAKLLKIYLFYQNKLAEYWYLLKGNVTFQFRICCAWIQLLNANHCVCNTWISFFRIQIVQVISPALEYYDSSKFQLSACLVLYEPTEEGHFSQT